MDSSRPSNGYFPTPSPSRPSAATDGRLPDNSRTAYSTRPLPQPQQSGPRTQPATSYLPVSHQVSSIAPSASPSELKRRRPPSHQPSVFSLGDGTDGGVVVTADTDKLHPSDGEFISRDDFSHSSASPLIPAPTFSSSTTPSSAYRNTRRNSDPDDKEKHKHGLLRRLLMRLLPHRPPHQPHTSRPRSRQLSLEKGMGSHSVEPTTLWDSDRPVGSVLRIAFAVCAVVVLVLAFTLMVHGGPTALLYITHPFSHLLSPFSPSPQPAISPLSTLSADSPASVYTPALLSAIRPSLSSSDFTIVASFYTNEQSSASSSRLLQWHTLLSYVALTPPSHVLVYTNQPTACAEFVLKAYPDMQCFYLSDYYNVEFQLPYVDRLLSHAHSHALDDLIVYTHHDAVLSRELASSVHHLMDVLPYHQFVATSKRLETRLPYELVSLKDFSRSYVDDIVALGRAMNRMYANEWNIDLLVYSKYWFEQLTTAAGEAAGFPPFVFADYYWSNHMLGVFLLSPHITAVDLTPQRLLLHIKSNDTVDGIYVSDMRSLALYNLRLARNMSERYLYGQLNNIPYQLTGRCPACQLQLSGSGSIDLLARKQSQHGWLIVVEVAEKDTTRVWNWLCWAERANVSNYLLVTDSASASDYRQMYELGFPILFTDGSDGSTGLIGYLLQKGYSVLTMDLDHLLLQAPWAYLQASPFDVMVKGDDANLYAGILVLRASHYSHYFYTAVTQCTAASSTQGADVLACAARTFRDMKQQVKGGLLDILHFPTVKSFFVDQLSQRTGTYPLVLETSESWSDELGLNIYRGGGQCESAQRLPFPPFSVDTPIIVRILTSTNLPGLKALLASLSSAQYEAGAVVRLEVAIDYPWGNVTSSVIELYQQVVSYASSFVFAQGSVLVSVQDTQHVSSARLLVADHDESSDAHVLLLSDDVQLSSMWHTTLRHLLSLCAQQYDPQLMGISLTTEDVVLGETHAKRSAGRHAMDDVARLLGNGATMFGWQQPSPAVLLFPGFYHELLYFVDRMQSAYPNYHPCVPTLITNHRRRYLEFLSKWMYTRGTYLLYLSLPDHHVLAVQAEQSSTVVEPRYVRRLLNLQTYTQMLVGSLARPAPLRVFDFHIVERAAGALESRAAVERRSKQCWVQSDWKNEANVIQMDEDELMSEAEEQRRHTLHRERQLRKQSEVAALAAQHQGGDRAATQADAMGLEGHKVAREAVAGVRVVGGEAKGNGAKRGEWEEAAARDIAESQAHNLALAMKEGGKATQPAPAAAAAEPAAPAAAAAPATPPLTGDEALNEAIKKMTPEQRTVYEQMKSKEAQKAADAPVKPAV